MTHCRKMEETKIKELLKNPDHQKLCMQYEGQLLSSLYFQMTHCRKMEETKIKELKNPDHQKCYMNIDFMQKNSIKVAAFVLLSFQGKEYVCQTWPSSQPSCYDVQYSTVVYREPMAYYHSDYSSVCHIKIIKTEIVDVINISLIVTDLDTLAEFKSEYRHSPHRLNDISKQLLYKLSVTSNCVINCEHMDLAKMYGVSFIVINSDQNEVKEKILQIDYSTEIKIDHIQFKEHFIQMSNTKKKELIGGLDSVLKELEDLIMIPFEFSKLNVGLSRNIPRGILLRGPPGTGKTSVVREISRRCHAFLITINGPEVIGARPGETEENMHQIFNKALTMSHEGPCILFIDEIDSLCPRRWKSGDSQESKATSALLTYFDRISSGGSLVIIGATNRPGELDPALRRPGRFDKECMINVPTFNQRKEILKVHISKFKECGDLDLDKIAELTNGYVGADLAAVCNEAAYMALGKSADSESIQKVEYHHFLSAVKKVMPSMQKGSECTVDFSPVSWNDIGGLDQVKVQLKQAVEWPMKHPEAFLRMGLPLPKGVLLYGPPGCCKTTLVKAAATACGATFLSVSGAQLYSPFVGDSEKMISEIFHRARAGAPSIIFLDEVDSIIGKRGDTSSQRSVQERVLSTLLNEMDGIGIRLDDKMDSKIEEIKVCENQSSTLNCNQPKVQVNNRNILVVAATNRPDLLDEALTRPGRLDRVIYVPPPDVKARLQILSLLTMKMSLHDVCLNKIADITEFYTGADLQNLCREAALNALTEDMQATTVTMDNFEKALLSCQPSLTCDLITYYKNLCSSKKAIDQNL